MHCLTMQCKRMSVTLCRRHGFMLPTIFWLKLWSKMLELKW